VNPIFAAALELQRFCAGQGWRYCFIGAVAVQRWGEPRLTLDVDLSLLTGFGSEERFVDGLLARFSGRRPDARDFALRYRVLLLASSSGVPLDVALGAMPFEERAVGRASDFDIGEGQALLTCSAEDLLVFKTFAGRDKDWLDIEGIAVRQARLLDEALVFNELEPLLELKGTPEAGVRLRTLLDRARS
jgi:hypothetical protein